MQANFAMKSAVAAYPPRRRRSCSQIRGRGTARESNARTERANSGIMQSMPLFCLAEYRARGFIFSPASIAFSSYFRTPKVIFSLTVHYFSDRAEISIDTSMILHIIYGYATYTFSALSLRQCNLFSTIFFVRFIGCLSDGGRTMNVDSRKGSFSLLFAPNVVGKHRKALTNAALLIKFIFRVAALFSGAHTRGGGSIGPNFS